MAVADDVRLMANGARCYELCIPPGMQGSVLIYLLAQILQNQDPSADVTSNTLLQGGRCFDKCIPPGSQTGAIIYLLYQLAYGGEGGNCCITLEDAPINRATFPANEPPPTDLTHVWERTYRDGSPSIIWDAVAGQWLVL